MEDPATFRNLPKKIDAVIHLAALVSPKEQNFERYLRVNALGLRSLLEEVAKRGCRKIVYASTGMVFGKPLRLPARETDPTVPISDYGLSKYIGEIICLAAQNAYAMQIISLRFAHIYGAGEQEGYVLTTFIQRARGKFPLVIHGPGNTRKDFVYVKDAVRALDCALRADSASGVFNIANGRGGVRVAQLAQFVARVFSDGASRVVFDRKAGGKSESFHMSTAKARKVLGFVPGFTLATGLMDYRHELEKRNSKG